jgi:hypothetical protein
MVPILDPLLLGGLTAGNGEMYIECPHMKIRVLKKLGFGKRQVRALHHSTN